MTDVMNGTTVDPTDLSPRQQQVLDGLRQGKQNKTIAHELSMAESTVKVHVRNMMKKVNARNRTQLVMKTQGHKTQAPEPKPEYPPGTQVMVIHLYLKMVE